MEVIVAIIHFLTEWAGWIFGFIATAFAIRGSVKFDVNRWFENRRKQHEKNLESLCPHFNVIKDEGEIILQPSFPSEYERCVNCNNYKFGVKAYVEANEKYWLENLDSLKERNQKVKALVKKLGR
jgi:hypothetical protein